MSLTLRSASTTTATTKGAALTHAEMDANWLHVLQGPNIEGLAIGTDVQSWDINLDQISALAVTDSNFIVGNGTTWVVESGATARTSLGFSAIAAKGDLLAGTAANTIGTLTAGSNEARLVADSTQATGLKYVFDSTHDLAAT